MLSGLIIHLRIVSDHVSTLSTPEAVVSTYQTFTSMRTPTPTTRPVDSQDVMVIALYGLDLFTLTHKLPEVAELPEFRLNLGLYWTPNEPLPELELGWSTALGFLPS